jgi:large subunit ribosomal protein L15
MQDVDLHAPAGANKQRRILGRGQGSGRGTTAGKGNKGQQSRSGGKTYVGFEGGQMPLYRRIAHRGFSNYPFKKEFQIVNLGEIEKRYENDETVNVITLIQKGLVKGSLKDGLVKRIAAPVKVLGDGDFTKKLTFAIGAVSNSAKTKIEKAGGTIVAQTVPADSAPSPDGPPGRA